MEFKLLIAGIIVVAAKFFLSHFLRKRNIENRWLKKALSFIREIFDTIGFALVAAAIIMFFLIQAFKIPSGSMKYTFIEGDHLFVNKFLYGIHVPFSSKRFFPIRDVQRGDIIVFKAPNAALTQTEIDEGGKDFIKRCIAIAGDKVEIRNKLLLVNDEIVTEPYAIFVDPVLYEKMELFKTQDEYQRAWVAGIFAGVPARFVRDNFGPVIVPEGHFMMMGDNRDQSFDSRFFGPMPSSLIKGKALLRYYPFSRIKIV